MSRAELERKGCEVLKGLSESQMIYIITLAEMMFAKGAVQHG